MTRIERYMHNMVRLRRHHAAPAGSYACLEELLLAKGELYSDRPLTDREEALVKAARRGGKFPIKQCYANSQKVILGPHGSPFRYTEGYVLLPNLPIAIMHAWLDLDGAVVDLTLRGDTTGAEYWGMRFPLEAVQKFVASTGYYGSLIDDWKNGWPYMKIGYRP